MHSKTKIILSNRLDIIYWNNKSISVTNFDVEKKMNTQNTLIKSGEQNEQQQNVFSLTCSRKLLLLLNLEEV
jgi:hypothetical protein